ncbi:N-acetyltransferase family protein [Halobaculum sp. MBLA0147]|uniref:GNAT family N-acetyltransferase n=1 Tax=Halobaculum sp. MBLA0147 TaxID=3079934 RepID=UPI0035256064
MNVRAYETADADELWDLKRAFETGLGEAGGETKRDAYHEKLDDDYRTRWLGWVERCVDENPRCVQLAAVENEEAGGESTPAGESRSATQIAGYVFVLPESMAFVWDAAVLNEIYVAPRYRGTDVADRLLTAALEVARDQRLPLDRMVLDVDRENERARAFYRDHGFEHWGEMVARPLDGDETE